MNKKGQEELHIHIFYVICIIIVLAAMIYFVSDVSKGDAIKKQIMTKKLALLLDSAKPGTIITIDSENIIINKNEENNKISVKLSENEPAYEYEFYNPHNIELTEEENKIIIKVLEK